MDKIETTIREYDLDENVTIQSFNGRLTVNAELVAIDLRDIIDWVKENEPMLLEQE